MELERSTARTRGRKNEHPGSLLEKEISHQDHRLQLMHKDLHSQKDLLSTLDGQLDTIRSTSQLATDQLQEKQSENGYARAEIKKHNDMISVAQQKYESLKGQIAAEGQQLTSLQQNLLDLDALRQQDVARAAEIDKHIAALTQKQYQARQDLHISKQKEQNLRGELSGAQAQSCNLTQQIARMEEQVVRQQEVLYNVSFQLVQMERKVSRAQGQRSQDETQELKARIAALNQALEVVSTEHSMLQSQVKQAENDYARAQRLNHQIETEKSVIVDEISCTQRETEAVLRGIKATTKQKEEKQVEADVWRLETRRLRSLLAGKADKVMSLEHRKRALELGMEERRQEISVQMELMQGESRLLHDEVHRLILELRERQLSLEKLKAKYDTVTSKCRPPNGGELQSQAYYIIKAAQEREELQSEANSYRQRIAQTEHECHALQKHLDDLIGSNTEMNQHFRFSSIQQTVEEQASLKQQLDAAYTLLKGKRQEEQKKSFNVEAARSKLANLISEETHMRRLLEDLTLQKDEVEQQIIEQSEKTKRADLHVAKLRKQLATAPGQRSEIELDMQLSQMKQSTRSMLDHLKTLAVAHPEADIMEQVEKELGIKLGTDAGSSRPGSSRRSPFPSICSSPRIGGSPGARMRGSRPDSSSTCISSSSLISKSSVRSASLSVTNMQLEI